MTAKIAAAIVVAIATWAASATLAQERRSAVGQPPSLAIHSVAGRDLFEFYCASCHGRDGKGGGPVAAALKTPPADLTMIARRAGGTFPKARVERFVTQDGEKPGSAHGTNEMPVWGPIFRGLDPSDAMVKVRISNVVSYLESIQFK
jgi:mono/diheme cytochrome c family protein